MSNTFYRTNTILRGANYSSGTQAPVYHGITDSTYAQMGIGAFQGLLNARLGEDGAARRSAQLYDAMVQNPPSVGGDGTLTGYTAPLYASQVNYASYYPQQTALYNQGLYYPQQTASAYQQAASAYSAQQTGTAAIGVSAVPFVLDTANMDQQAQELIGKYIQAVYRQIESVGSDGRTTETQHPIDGFVNGVEYVDGLPVLTVDGLESNFVKLADVQYVVETSQAGATGAATTYAASAIAAGDPNYLLDKYVTASGGAEGVVTNITTQDGVTYAHIGDTKFDIRTVTDVEGGMTAWLYGENAAEAQALTDALYQQAYAELTGTLPGQAAASAAQLSYMPYSSGYGGQFSLFNPAPQNVWLANANAGIQTPVAADTGRPLQSANPAQYSAPNVLGPTFDWAAEFSRDPLLFYDGAFADPGGEPDSTGSFG